MKGWFFPHMLKKNRFDYNYSKKEAFFRPCFNSICSSADGPVDVEGIHRVLFFSQKRG